MKRVLVVDGPRETEQVLKAVLEPRGFAVSRIRACVAEADIAGEPFPPTVVVTHDEEEDVVTQNEDDNLQGNRATSWAEVPRIVIGSAEPSVAGGNRSADGQRNYLQKPFQYGELIHAIERILEQAAENDPRCQSPFAA